MSVALQRTSAMSIIAQHGACRGIDCSNCPLFMNNVEADAWCCHANDERMPKVGYMKEAVAYLFKTRGES
jgi:hypothetical protein